MAERSRRSSLVALVLVLAGALSIGACGADTDTVAGPGPTAGEEAPLPVGEWAAAELVDLPDGLEARLAEQVPGERRIGYHDRPGDRYDASVRVATSDPSRPGDPSSLSQMPLDRIVELSAPMIHPPVETEVRGHRALLATLTDEGRVYGYELTWDERPDLRVVVADSRDSASPDTVMELTDHLRGLTEDEWQERAIGLGIDSHVGRVDPASDRVEVGRGEIDGDEWALEAYVPPGYPLGDVDQRLTCLELTYRGETSGVQCDFLPAWSHLGGIELVFGAAPASAGEVEVRPAEGRSGFEPFTVATTDELDVVGQRYFVTAMPAGACETHVVSAADGAMIGFTAPGLDDPAIASCR